MTSTRPAAAAAAGNRIALLLNVLGSGGAQRRIATLANRFAELGHAVDVVGVDPGGPMRAMLSPAIDVVILVPEGAARRVSIAVHARRLAAYLERVRPTVLMSCVTDTHLLAVIATRLDRRRTPLVLRASRHPFRPIAPHRLLARLVEPVNLAKSAWCYARADGIVALTADGAAGLRRLLRDRPARIETILNPVVADAMLDRGGDRARRTADPVPLVLGIGRLVEQKDFATLIRAFAMLRATRPARLAILGDGGQAQALRALIRTLGIEHDVEMPGEVGEVAGWIRRADVVVSASLWEGLQATPVEALALGCPVVATDCPGGARETLEDGRIGRLVPVRDPARMAHAIAATIDAPPDPARLIASAARFTPAGKAERYLALFAACRPG